MGSIEWIEGDGGRIAVDERHFPIVLSTWIDAPDELAGRVYFQWLRKVTERARAEAVPLINITDAGLTSLPSSSVRRLIADLTLDWDREVLRGHRVRAFVVVENAVVRGVLNAISWMHGNMSAQHVSSLEIAAQHALEELRAMRVPLPVDFQPSALCRPTRKATSK